MELLQKAPPACDKQKFKNKTKKNKQTNKKWKKEREKWIEQKSDHQCFDFTLHILSLLH